MKLLIMNNYMVYMYSKQYLVGKDIFLFHHKEKFECIRLDYIMTTKIHNIKNKYDVINFVVIKQIFTKIYVKLPYNFYVC